MSFRIFITGSGIAEEARRVLSAENCVVEVGEPADTPELLVQKLRAFKPHGLIVRQGKITAGVQQASDNLKVICKHGSGTDNIDVAAATERGIPVMFTPMANFESVAEHTLALMLSLVRYIPQENQRVRSGIFDKKKYAGLELYQKTLGIIGFGKIARRLCELIAPFDMKVLVYHPSRSVEKMAPHITKVEQVSDIYAKSDIISLHCPLTPETKGMINENAIRQMKRGVFIINTARGEILDENDLLSALRDGRVGGAALDVFEQEPPGTEHPFLQFDNVISTPHVAGASDKSMINMGLQSVNNVLSVLRGEAPDTASLVNREILGRFQ